MLLTLVAYIVFVLILFSSLIHTDALKNVYVNIINYYYSKLV